MGDLTIIIVSFNTRAELEACLASIAAAPPSAAHGIIVVDNASSDGSPDAVRRNWPGVRLIASGRNLGFAAANNMGIREAASEFVLLLNSDTLVPPGAIDALLRALDVRRRRRGRGPAPGRRRRPPGALLRADDRTVQRAAAEAARAPVRSPRGPGRSLGRPSGAPAPLSGLGQRRVPARPARGCAGRGPARRAVLPLRGGRGFLRGPARARAAHPLHTRRRGGAPSRRVRTGTPAGHRAGVPAQPGGLLREAPSEVGAAPACVSPAARGAPRRAGAGRQALWYREPGDETPTCASPLTPGNCTTSASAPTSGTC